MFAKKSYMQVRLTMVSFLLVLQPHAYAVDTLGAHESGNGTKIQNAKISEKHPCLQAAKQ